MLPCPNHPGFISSTIHLHARRINSSASWGTPGRAKGLLPRETNLWTPLATRLSISRSFRLSGYTPTLWVAIVTRSMTGAKSSIGTTLTVLWEGKNSTGSPVKLTTTAPFLVFATDHLVEILHVAQRVELLLQFTGKGFRARAQRWILPLHGLIEIACIL